MDGALQVNKHTAVGIWLHRSEGNLLASDLARVSHIYLLLIISAYLNKDPQPYSSCKCIYGIMTTQGVLLEMLNFSVTHCTPLL